ncbi:MAG: hypothetical protein V4676_06970, partial [Bacteroidota bacterium]
MVPELRRQYNQKFTSEKYTEYINDLQNVFPGALDFRIAETPLFIPKSFTNKMLSACNSILEIIATPEYKKQSEAAIPTHLQVPNEDNHPQCLVFDFGICTNNDGALEPQLIEMQGFPSLFAWQAMMPGVFEKHFDAPEGYSVFLSGNNKETYLELLKEMIVGDCAAENVVLLEILPHQQKTRVDFYATEKLLGINTVCLTELIKEGKQLFYEKDGRRIPIHRIYNRVIFDDLFQQSKEIQEKGKILLEELDVTWVPHPAWFYRISKYTLPFINHPNVPQTQFLNTLKTLPDDLENYVVKPLFSFAGQGVIIDVTKADIEKITDPQNWIIQKKVQYAAAIETPEENAKAEIR